MSGKSDTTLPTKDLFRLSEDELITLVRAMPKEQLNLLSLSLRRDWKIDWTSIMTKPKTTLPTAIDEAMAHTRSVCGELTERERFVAVTAAKSAARWAKRVIAEQLQQESLHD